MKKIQLSILLASVVFLIASCSLNKNDRVANPLILTNSGAAKVSDAALSNGTQEIIKLQMSNWPEAVLELNCDKYDLGWKTYCQSEKDRVAKWKNELTWEKVSQKWNSYIRSFDCKEIVSDAGKKYCTDYKSQLPASSSTKSASGATASGATSPKPLAKPAQPKK